MKTKMYRIGTLLATAVVIAVSAIVTAEAQNIEGLRVGLIGGANYNYVDAPIQNFLQVPGNPDFGTHDFSGAAAVTGYGGIFGEYLFNDLVGASLRATLDARCVEKENDGSTFTPHLWYVSIEPGFRINLGMPELHANIGGSVSLPILHEYDYASGMAEGNQDITGADLMHTQDAVFGAWAGFGYDIQVTDHTAPFGLIIAPFAEGSYIFDQKEPDATMTADDTWNTLTVRAGVEVKATF